ncbi:unnamed protein product [Moneuplotes crassus]|uniref:ABC transporter domain-containing protein n=2 Tax=Euplotes crassus TaxID=5936 RepID=A0AAD1YAX2_EUPCR|nr:unnamed protein product [Moneuplotes crassus]
MAFCRHLQALCWKNWLLWRRKLCGSLCEIIFPLLIVGALVGIKSTSDSYEYDGGSWISIGHLFAIPDENSKFYQDLNADDGLFVGSKPQPFYMTPRGGNYYTIVGTDRDEVDQMRQAMKPFIQVFQETSGREMVFLNDLETEEDLFDFIKGPDYKKDSRYESLWFAIGLPTDPENDPYNYKIYQSDDFPQLIPSTHWDKIFPVPDFDSYYLYARYGFTGLQSVIGNYILQKETQSTESFIDTYIALGFFPKLLEDGFLRDGGASFPLFMLIIFITPLFRLVNFLTEEKSSRAREGMKIMGLNDTPYWASWFIYYFSICLVISVASGVAMSLSIFKSSSMFFVILWIFLYGMSLFSFAVFISSFISKPLIACIIATLFHFMTYFIVLPLNQPEISDGVRIGFSIIPNVAMSLSMLTMCDLEQALFGLNGSTLFYSKSKFQVGIAFISFLINFIGLFLIGVYLDNVLPKQFGKRQHPCFMFKKSYWFGTTARSENEDKERLLAGEGDSEQNNNPENFEAVPPNVRQFEKSGECMKVRNLRKVYGDGKVAVDDLSLTMYKDQIFALLGHNGAGKTTTFSILMGLYQPSGGSASVFNINMVDQSDQVRKNLGVCPQFDILFDTLTPEEHLRLYCMFKGVPPSEVNDQIEKTLKDVDLMPKRKAFAKNLSGGQKRKLSVGIAMIGGSKLILLDEPTSGMDLTARRKIWDMLKRNKQDRIILLTTHFMDEADILGDRIAIMTSGKVKCCGGSLFLKKKFGVGYNLVIAKETKLPNPDIEKFVFSRIENCIKLSEVSSEITFQIPMAESDKFESFFTDLDNSLGDLKIKSYGVGVTTLEEVFLKVGHQNEEENKDSQLLKQEETKEGFDNPQTQSQLNFSRESGVEEYSIADKHEKNVFWLHYYALCVKKFLISFRQLRSALIEILIPMIFIILGLALSNLEFFKDPVPYNIDLSEYPSKNKIYVSMIQPEVTEFQQYVDAIDKDVFDVETPEFPRKFDRLYEDFLQFESDTFYKRNGYDSAVLNSGNHFVNNIDLDTNRCGIVATINGHGKETVPIHMGVMLQTCLRVLLNQPNLELKFRSHPIPLTADALAGAKAGSGSIISFLFAIAFAMIPTGVAASLVKERESNVKHQQMISGASKISYWLSTYTIDVIRGFIPICFGIIMIFAFGVDLPNIWVHFILFGFAIHPFTYATTFWFKKHGVAQLMTIIINIALGAFVPIAILVMQTIKSTQNIAKTLRWLPRIFPIYSMINGITQISIRSLIARQEGLDDTENSLNLNIAGGDAMFLAIDIFFWWGVTILSEAEVFQRIFRKIKCGRVIQDDFSRRTENVRTDSDVLKEELRCEQLDSKECSVLVNGLRKGFTVNGEPFVAVKNISFGLENGECFALLGVNGAGKSTTFKSMTGDIIPSDGKIYIDGYDISSAYEFSEARKLIGYCPQVDAIFEGMTVLEHLVFYSRIKGILAHKRTSLIQKVMDELDLESFKHVRCEKLSGGNKRKLSVAMAMIGNPPIIFLDEPSTGMDPRAKRFMWTIISRISTLRKKSTIILTTHSMEEAEALCTKMGIMVRGRFKCFGSSQEIKDKFGTGYEVEVKVKWPTDEEALNYIKDKEADPNEEITAEQLESTLRKIEMQRLIEVPQFLDLEGDVRRDGSISLLSLCQWALLEESGYLVREELQKNTSDCKILEHYNNFYKFRIERGAKSLGFFFGFMESLKTRIDFEEYGVSQTSLEQIFNNFAREQEIGDDNSQRRSTKREAD